MNKIIYCEMNGSSVFQGKKAAFCTLGCKLNFAETSTYAEKLEKLGVTQAEKGECADVCIVNTCSVTEVADHKCRQAIHKIVRENPGAFVVVTGCYAQLEPEAVASIKGIDMVLGNEEKAKFMDYLLNAWFQKLQDGVDVNTSHYVKTKDIVSFAPSCSRGNRTRYFLKVQDGCNCYCTYCTIPFARGNSRCPSISFLIGQAEDVARRGGKEIVLTGVNIGDFGRTTGESFLDLLKALDGVEGIKRYRISSLEPDLLSDDIIRFCASSRAFMPHFHLPLQSGSNEVLKLMHRRYARELFADRVVMIKEYMPDAFIGVDVMVGCRGERPECFADSYDFIRSLDVTQLHVFPYSERPGTAALRIPYVVDEKEKKERSQRVMALSDEKLHRFYESFIGSERDVLVEKSARGGVMHGFTDNYIRVELPADASAGLDNEIVRVKLGPLNEDKTALKAVVVNR